MISLPDRTEAHCPHCGAGYFLSAAARHRKIQCPTCRQIVAIPLGAEPPVAVHPTAAQFAELQTRVAEQAALIEELLAAKRLPAEPLLAAPTTTALPGDSLLSPGQTLRWLRRETQTWGAPEEDAEQQAVLLHNLRAMGQRDIVLQAGLDEEAEPRREDLPDMAFNTLEARISTGEVEWKNVLGQLDASVPGRAVEVPSATRIPHLSASALVGRLSAVFRAAGWTVSEPAAARARAHGLVLAAGQCPMPKAATAIYMAFKAAGFPIVPRLDGTLGPEQSILIAGTAAASTC